MSSNINQSPEVWRIQLYGSLTVVAPTGAAVTVPGKKTSELLAYIALHPDRPHSREKLIDIIWGDSDVGDVRTRLRQEISKLRSVLVYSGDDTSPLLVTKDSCRILSDTVVDVIQFEEACLQANRETDLDRKRLLYLDAASLYISDLLLGFDIAWIVSERTRLRGVYSRALLNLAEAQRQLQDYSGAEESLGWLTSHDPLDEECYLALMRLYADLGQPARVQQQCQAMEKALKEGLGISPTTGSLTLAAELREAAGKRASEVPASQGEGPLSGQMLASPTIEMRSGSEAMHVTATTVLQQSSRQSALRTGTLLRTYSWQALMLVTAAAVAAGLFGWRTSQSISTGAVNGSAKIEGNKEQWIYHYQPRTDERPNSEGRPVVADNSGASVTVTVDIKGDNAAAALPQDRQGLFNAVANGDVQLVKEYLAAGVSPNVTNSDGATAFFRAVADRRPDLIIAMLPYDPDVNFAWRPTVTAYTPLMVAAINGDVRTIKALLQIPGVLKNQQDVRGQTALRLACRDDSGYAGNAKAVKALVDAGADQTIRDAYRWTAYWHVTHDTVKPHNKNELLKILKSQPW